MISCMISYHIKDLTVPSPEAVAFQIERVASCLGPSTVEITLPLNAALVVVQASHWSKRNDHRRNDIKYDIIIYDIMYYLMYDVP
jgi:hypothetical protein